MKRNIILVMYREIYKHESSNISYLPDLGNIKRQYMHDYRCIKISPIHNIELIKALYEIKQQRVFKGFEVHVVKTFAGRKCILMRKMSQGYKHLKRRRAFFNLKCKWMRQKYHKTALRIFYKSS